ncbi:MAG: DUF2085 domain-containing protein [Ignavibacteria bacterium]|nr:DUF2085 domain-containing protein [Ignavibacteria bacterium]MCU7518760.1 DUF2085 domain-containing protein [Ignavibacteria bacterium]MCU7522837.1 DUF2085 domain-containing protein [Ignavibacteria bacterium]
MKIKIKYFLFILMLIWFTGIFLNVLVPCVEFPAGVYLFSELCYSHVCHQITEKTIFILGRPLLVCSRCFGIYAGLFAASLFSLFISVKRPLRKKYLIFAGIPMLLDVMLYSVNIYNYSKITAFLTGLLLGSVGFFYILGAFEKFIAELKSQDRNLN